MTPPQLVHSQPLPSVIAQKVQLTYKLFLLETARDTLEQELRNFTNKAYEEVQGFFSSSFPSGLFSDLANKLDMKCQAFEKLSSLLKDMVLELDVCVQQTVRNGLRTNQLQPLGHKRFLKTDVLRFGPMLQNVLMTTSIAKAVQVLGAALSLRQLKNILKSAVVQDDDMICSVSSSYNSIVRSSSLSCHLKAEETEQAVICVEKRQMPDALILPPAIMQSPEIDSERPPLLLPPIQAIIPEISNPKPMRITPLISWGTEDDVTVQHQKQTSSQLLHFLRAGAKNVGAMAVTEMEWTKTSCTSSSSQQTLPTIQTQSYQFKHDGLIRAPTKTLHADTENLAPVFSVKQVESTGSLTYTCVIATQTELWDVGDILTEVVHRDSDSGPLEKEDCIHLAGRVENTCLNIQWRTNSIEIPEFQIQKFEETEVFVSHIVSPGNFYIQHADFLAKLQALVTDSWKATRSYASQNCIPDIGTQVMGWFPKQEQWCRAQVTKICGVSKDTNSDSVGNETSIKVEVRRLDYGDTACLSLLNVKELTPDMAVLPLQAVQVSLANVTPVNGSNWSEEALSWFKAMVHNRTLYARLYPRGPTVTVELFLEKGKLGAMRRGAPLSLRLTQNGHAKHSKMNNVSLVKRSTVQLRNKELDLGWEKYLISCYTQNQK